MPAVVKDIVWEHAEYVPHEGQRTIHASLARNRVAACGRRFGKSTVGGLELVPEAIKTYSLRSKLEQAGKSRIFWIVGPDYSDDEKEWRHFYNALRRMEMPFDKPGTYNDPMHGNMHVSLWGGLFQVHGKSGMHPEGLDGEGLSGVELVEAAKLKPFIWYKYLRPSLADERGWSLMTSTPEGRNWFYTEWQKGQDPSRPTWESWRMPSWLNLNVYPGGREDQEIIEMQADMTEERFNQEIAADFSEYVGAVFKDFDEQVHVGDFEYRPDLPLYAATDYGWSNPFVWLGIQIDAFDNVFVIGEYRVTHRDINDISRDLQQIPWARNASLLFPEPAEPDTTAVLEKALHVKVSTNTGGDLKVRLDLIREHLKYDPETEGHPDEIRKPKLFIDRRCIGSPLGDGGLVREMQDYRYPKTKEESQKAEPERPLDKDDHGPEALGRFFRGYFGAPTDPGPKGRARVRKAVIRSG